MQVDPVEFDTASGWAIRIYEKMKEDLEAKKIETWHHGYDKLMDCSLCVVERGCCKKRKLMLAMTSQILDWLKQHQEEINSICVGELRKTVYARPDTFEPTVVSLLQQCQYVLKNIDIRSMDAAQALEFVAKCESELVDVRLQLWEKLNGISDFSAPGNEESSNSDWSGWSDFLATTSASGSS